MGQDETILPTMCEHIQKLREERIHAERRFLDGVIAQGYWWARKGLKDNTYLWFFPGDLTTHEVELLRKELPTGPYPHPERGWFIYTREYLRAME